VNTRSASDISDLSALVENARQCAQAGQLQQATSLYSQILQLEPHQPEALNFFATQALGSGRFSQSIELLQRALTHSPGDASLYKNLGLAYRGHGELPEALAAFDAALRIKPDYPVALLNKGTVLEQTGRHQEALKIYLAALSLAGYMGLLVEMQNLPAGLRQLLEHAITVVQLARAQHLTQKLAPLRLQHAATEFKRVDQCLRMYLGQEPLITGHPVQRPTFMTFPGLPTHGWFERTDFPWLEKIESRTTEIRDELIQVLRADHGFRPFIEMPRGHPGTAYWEALNYSPNWNAFFFYRDGRRFDENCRRCPITAQILDSLPLSRVEEHSPEVFFSVLKPGAYIPPHTGVINTRLVTHLPLIIPPDCGIRVGDETRGWKEGECIVFDDTFEHEAWNRSDQTRVVLIFDIWNPYLSETEKQAMRLVVEEIGHFNQLHGQSDQAYVSD
jgi:aspartyl/asparaginyl beta-hydroxylase (cupin superfamily)/Tfp pilus assembly protein PilF